MAYLISLFHCFFIGYIRIVNRVKNFLRGMALGFINFEKIQIAHITIITTHFNILLSEHPPAALPAANRKSCILQ
jgi:hypothetical protein